MTLTARSGAAAGLAAARDAALYPADTKDVPELAERLTAYLGEAFGPEKVGGTAAIPARCMHPLVAEVLGIDVSRSQTLDEMTNLLAGLTTKGEAIPGKEIQRSTKDKARTAFTDFTFSAPKSFSIALALAKSDAERQILETCWLKANEAVCRLIESHIGGARQGRDGQHGVIPGHMAWVNYHHYTSRPTVMLADGENTQVATVPTLRPGDMQRHTHNYFLHVTVTDDGQVKAPNLMEAHERIHEWGAIGHAYLATELRKAGIRAEIDPRTEMSHLPDVPELAVKLFSARTEEGEAAARAYAAENDVDWDTASAKTKRNLINGRIGVLRNEKMEGPADYAAWVKTAADAGYEHKSVIDPDYRWTLPSRAERTRMAYEASLPLLEKEWTGRAKLNGNVPRIKAARGMIASGIQGPDDINPVLDAYRTEGVIHDGEKTALLSALEHGKRFGAVTTALHEDREREAIGLLAAAAADKTAALSHDQIKAAVQRVSAAQGLDFTSEHGLKQRAMIEALATAGRATVGVGVAGSGKTSVAAPLIDAHHAAGWESYGVTLAWRQTRGLVDAGIGRKKSNGGPKLEPDTDVLTSAGIGQQHTYAMAPFLTAVEKGDVKPDAKTLVVIDEIATIPTIQILQIARFQAAHGFKIIGLGDDRQAQAVEAGSTINLFRRALGSNEVPEILETIRQHRISDRETAALFRQGKAGEALARKDADGLLTIVPGSYRDTIRAGVDWWERRIAERADRENYSIGITVPTNADVMAVGLEVRSRQRTAGKLTGEDWTVGAIDQRGVQYDLVLAVGDKVRLFDKVNASFGKGSRGRFGVNGTTADVVSIDKKHGLRLRRDDGKVGAIKWSTLQDKKTGRIRLSYGTALTIVARQSETLTDHLTLFPAGTAGVNAFAMYPADTRNREDSQIIVSHGAEKQEIRQRRPMGDPWLAEATDAEMRQAVIENMARNLSRQPEKVLAVEFIDRSVDLDYGAVNSHQASWFRKDTQPGAAERPVKQPQEAASVKDIVTKIAHSPIKRLTGPELRRQKRSMRTAAERPKRVPKGRRIYQGDARTEFAQALRQAGLSIQGDPIMDGKWQYVRVDGNKSSKKSGRYRGYTDGRPAGWITNYKTGLSQRWVADGEAPVHTPDERVRQQAQRDQRERERQENSAKAEKRAFAIWSGAKGVRSHPYLDRKGVKAHDVRIDGRGNLLLPMRDENRYLRSVQTIYPDGTKRFPRDGRKAGLFGQIGEIDPNKPYMIAQDYATAASLHEITGFPVVYTYDAGNVVHVGRVLKAKYPEATQIYAGDNDHHLPRQVPPLLNTGKEKAEATAKETSGVLLLPSFGEIETKPLVKGETPPTNWNDFVKLYGRPKAYADISARLKSEGIPMAIQPDKDAAKIIAKERSVPSDAAREAARKLASATPQNRAQEAQRLNQAQEHRHNKGARL